MTVFVWRLLSAISAALFVALTVLSLCLRLLKNVYYQGFQNDEFVKDVQTGSSKNSIYFTSGETRKYIKKYVVCKTLYDKYLVCNFTENFNSISYFVVQYSRGKKVLGVLRVNEYATGDSSKVIALNRGCAHVNVIIGSADDVVINNDVIRPMTVNKIRLYAFIKSALLFFGLFVVRHAIIELVAGKEYMVPYLKNLFNYIAVAASAAFAVFNYFITEKCFRRKNVKGLSGGALEYDFL